MIHILHTAIFKSLYQTGHLAGVGQCSFTVLPVTERFVESSEEMFDYPLLCRDCESVEIVLFGDLDTDTSDVHDHVSKWPAQILVSTRTSSMGGRRLRCSAIYDTESSRAISMSALTMRWRWERSSP